MVVQLYGVHGRSLEAVNSFNETTKNCVRGEGEESEMFSVNDGSGAGMCNVSTVFFNF